MGVVLGWGWSLAFGGYGGLSLVESGSDLFLCGGVSRPRGSASPLWGTCSLVLMHSAFWPFGFYDWLFGLLSLTKKKKKKILTINPGGFSSEPIVKCYE